MRSEIGRVVGHSRAIDVVANHGRRDTESL